MLIIVLHCTFVVFVILLKCLACLVSAVGGPYEDSSGASVSRKVRTVRPNKLCFFNVWDGLEHPQQLCSFFDIKFVASCLYSILLWHKVQIIWKPLPQFKNIMQTNAFLWPRIQFWKLFIQNRLLLFMFFNWSLWNMTVCISGRKHPKIWDKLKMQLFSHIVFTVKPPV